MDDVGIGDIVPPTVSSSSESQEGDHATDLQSGGDDNSNEFHGFMGFGRNLGLSSSSESQEGDHATDLQSGGDDNNNEFHGFMGFGRNLGMGFMALWVLEEI
ncbi:hypothetical protein NC651_027400 [Populus alba x Populus x berolinensis]|nr:hypothetical protein NC651_027400 [Populus alba x Populus x berolinensis]